MKLNQLGAAPILILVAIIGVVAFLAISSSAPFKNNLLSSLFPKEQSQAATFDPNTKTFLETFGDGTAPKNADGTFAPHTPKNWSDEHWYIMDTGTEDHPGNAQVMYGAMEAEHGTDCGKPPATHHIIGDIDSAVFQCRDHLMTAFSSGGDGYISLVPDHLVDISQGTATIRFDVSTSRHSDRDWMEFILSPMANNMPLSGTGGNFSVNSIRLRQTNQNNNFCFLAQYIEPSGNVKQLEVQPGDIWQCTYNMQGGQMATSPEKRTTFEIRVSKTHFWFGIKGGQTDINGKPINGGQDFAFADKDVSLPWNNGVFMIDHGSYNPGKDEDECFGGVCGPNTWHWDNVYISPAIPFTLIKGDKRRIGPATGKGDTINFPKPAPANSFLKYSTFRNPQISTNGGATWSTAAQIPHWTDPIGNPCTVDADCYQGAFYTPIPAGTTQVKFRAKPGTDDSWIVKDTVIWSTTAPQATATPSPSPSPTLMPSPTPSPSPSKTPTPSPSSTPVPSPSSKPGDIDGNNKVDIFDYNTLLSNFGKTGTNLPGDFDNNGKVDIFDFNILLTNFGK